MFNPAFNQETGNIMIEGTGTSDLALTLMESSKAKLLAVVRGIKPLKGGKISFSSLSLSCLLSSHSKVERKFSTLHRSLCMK
jgi:hypothetical protein